jgi:hypothetical protein
MSFSARALPMIAAEFAIAKRISRSDCVRLISRVPHFVLQ